MDAPILSRAGPVGERFPDPRGPEGDHGLPQRLPEPALTLQMIEAAIQRQHVIEDEGERIFAHAQNLLASVKAERARLLDEISHLRDDLSETRALLRQTCRDLAAAEHRAALAEHRAQDLAARNDEMARFCARLVDAVEPMMEP
ncbi:hypothetical protein MMSR116_29520 [Methylobacterium mesophilicum SR1.6/6]|uniref:Uncharacterized protein n=1 Tax=Methylobacterium mesophilicum SR1.6/6 TaxID=908290 RepID=A0A6B9FV25_9HYPH|nr:hypothetical protein [Methylobacterium mesophilicum]QGY05576.1 hypothetical protein MMSR116_29520 [Methylobacterium mesophilicum SR1.6/6]